MQEFFEWILVEYHVISICLHSGRKVFLAERESLSTNRICKLQWKRITWSFPLIQFISCHDSGSEGREEETVALLSYVTHNYYITPHFCVLWLSISSAFAHFATKALSSWVLEAVPTLREWRANYACFAVLSSRLELNSMVITSSVIKYKRDVSLKKYISIHIRWFQEWLKYINNDASPRNISVINLN